MGDGPPREIFALEDDLRRIGLDLPQPARLVRMLRRQGIPIADALTLTEARQAILAAYRGDRRGTH
jgi:hypothetical protein